ncbi:MAG: Transcription-repair-coupling factor [Chlamydiae bacterium]|nr:Transcription-repair-coupling factor [Chlamydiota bacterium]
MDPRELYLKNPPIQEFCQLVQKEKALLIEEIWDSPKALLASLARQECGKRIVIITGGEREGRLFDDFAFFYKGSVVEFPAWETLPSEDVPPSPDIVGERYKILQEKPDIILTSLQACLQRLLPPDRLDQLHLVLKTGETHSFDTLPDRLTEMGYHRKAIAADKGEFAIRGGIIDIFPVSSPDPVRIEFFEDEIESIRTYDPVSQVSVGKISKILITPGEELELLHEEPKLSTLFDYLGPETIVIFDDLLALEDKYVSLKTMLGKKTRTFGTLEELLATIEPLQKIYFTSSPIEELSEIKVITRPNKLAFQFFDHELTAERWRNPFLPLFPTICPPEINLDEFSADNFLEALKKLSITYHFLTSTESEENSLKKRVGDLPATFGRGYLSSGFMLEEPSFALIPMTELTHHYKVRRQKQRSHYHSLPVEMFALSAGETIVHEKNGVGRYLGVEKRPNHVGVETEYLLLEYAEGAKLYVPMEQANQISKYIGAGDEVPTFHTLGSSRWKRTRERTEQAIVGYAKDLLQMQAERASKGGFSFPSDSEQVSQFANDFPYIETPDQVEAIAKVSDDMLSNRSMDRLVLGDVGYGKTEIAMRAAFKTVIDGNKQVAILVPTTVLAMQHFETFSERMANFPIKIGLLSRFCSPKEIKKTIEGIGDGTVDIVIGTHRIVSKDIDFKDLGLMIIDEEQRFGVRTKEHLKKFKKDIDCITLSATPIPRTLYMSLVGARDMSPINTPPEDRLPIQTIVCSASDQIIKNALLRELARDGQAFFIHNRVETIFQMADRIRKLIPEARIVVGHGQMPSSELDTVFHAFKNGQADILVSTTIIETGIDIPNANTILVDRADRFGLADLYQIRGRVGRWNKKAFCYFLVPNTHNLSEIARKRLSALSSSSGYGGGMKIAMRDLEIRGAGNILGTQQSGHVSSIGFHLYCKLLKRAIKAFKSKRTPLLFTDIKMEFPYPAHLPSNYINEITLRMEIYQRLGDCEGEEEVDKLFDEIHDRFGAPPRQVEWLYRLTRIRLFAAQKKITLLRLTKRVLLIEKGRGKQVKMIIEPPKSPQELETMILETLKKILS